MYMTCDYVHGMIFVFCFLCMAMICLYICFIMIIDIMYLVSEMDVYL